MNPAAAAARGDGPADANDVSEAGGLSGLLEAFSSAAERFRSERVRQSLFFAGRPAVLDVVGLALFERIAPTFAHLRASPTAGTPITLSVWDQALTGVPAPPFTNDAELLWKRPDWTSRVTPTGDPIAAFAKRARDGWRASID